MPGNSAIPENNGDVITISQIIKVVMSSATESELGALFVDCREIIPVYHVLKITRHK
jgi:hypothetical protein